MLEHGEKKNVRKYVKYARNPTVNEIYGCRDFYNVECRKYGACLYIIFWAYFSAGFRFRFNKGRCLVQAP